MPWFQRLCRQTGLMLHHLAKPVAKPEKRQVNRSVQEKPINETTVLRRTTIDEIEIKRDAKST